MNFRDELARIIAGDPRYSIEVYAFVLEALNHAKSMKLKRKTRDRDKSRSREADRQSRPSQSKKVPVSGHVTGRELCDSVRRLALRQFGSMAATVLNHWGVRSTSDIGDIVYNMIAAGDLEKTPTDSRSDFDKVFDFDTALRPKFSLPAEDLA